MANTCQQCRHEEKFFFMQVDGPSSKRGRPRRTCISNDRFEEVKPAQRFDLR